jgi:kynurenine formamidase
MICRQEELMFKPLLKVVVVLVFACGTTSASANDSRAQALLAAIAKARVIDLSHTWDSKSPIASVNPPFSMALAATHGKTRGMFKDGDQLSFAAEKMEWSGQHGAPSIDAIGHIGRDGKLYGGVDAAAATSDPAGIGASGVGAHLAIDQYPAELLVNRGILLDVATMVQKNATPLPPDFEITAKHLQEAVQREGVTLRKGDTVLIRTGWGQYFKGNPAKYAGEASPGLGLDGANYLIKIEARVAGNDTLTFEKRPPVVKEPKFQVFPVHMRLIADSGIYIIENLDLEALAKAKAYEFPVVVPPLKVKGGTGSALRAFALVPR